MPTVVTLLDGNDNTVELNPIDHGAPVVTMNTLIAYSTNVTAMANNDLVHPKVLHEMKCLGGWFNPTALKYIVQSEQNDKLEPSLKTSTTMRPTPTPPH